VVEDGEKNSFFDSDPNNTNINVPQIAKIIGVG